MKEFKRRKLLIATLISGLVLTGVFTTGRFTYALSNDEVLPTETPVETPVPVEIPTPTPAPVEAISSISVTEAPQTVVFGGQLDPELFKINITYMNGVTESGTADEVTVDTSSTGMKTVTVIYEGVATSVGIQVIPRAPQGLRMSDGTPTSIRVNWDVQNEAIRYELEMKNDDGSFSPVGVTSVNAYDFTGLTRGQLKYIRIRAVSEDTDVNTGSVVTGQSGYSAEYAIAPKPEDMNGAVTPVKLNRASMVFTWDPVAGATGYTVYQRQSPEEVLKEATAEQVNTNNGKIKYKITGLKGGYDYYIRVVPFAGDSTNSSGGSAEVLYGTAPTLPVVTARGGEDVIRVNYSGGRGADNYKLYLSKDGGEYNLVETFETPVDFKVYSIHDLDSSSSYEIKMTAERTVAEQLLVSESDEEAVSLSEVSPTSTAAKFYKTKKSFKKSPACKNYKDFKKKMAYAKSFAVPGLINTNVGGFNSTTMVPQSVALYKSYILISAYDSRKVNDSVIYVVGKSDKALKTVIVLPHKGHLGGIAGDGTNIWMAYGTKLACMSGAVIDDAVASGEEYHEVFYFKTIIPTGETISYITYYKDRLWAGAYDELKARNVYVYSIENKNETPTLTKTGQMLLPDRTQGISFSKKGEMIVSRSCQTDKTKRGFMSKLFVYKPDIDVNSTMTMGDMKASLQLPPMNEGIVVGKSYVYVLFESPAFSACQAPVDRVMAFNISKLYKK